MLGDTAFRFRVTGAAGQGGDAPPGWLRPVKSKTTSSSLPPPVRITGTVFDDANGSKVQNGGELGTNAGGLVCQPAGRNGNVVATTSVNASGLYTFTNVTPNTTYVLQLTTQPGHGGSARPGHALPANWVTTGENADGAPDATADSRLTVVVGASSVTRAELRHRAAAGHQPSMPPAAGQPGRDDLGHRARARRAATRRMGRWAAGRASRSPACRPTARSTTTARR